MGEELNSDKAPNDGMIDQDSGEKGKQAIVV